MTHQYIVQAIILENSRNFSIKNGACLCSRFTFDINPFIIQLHITQTIYGILSVMADNHVWAGNGNRQNTSITFKTTRQLTVLIVQTELLHRSGLPCVLIFSVDLERVTPPVVLFSAFLAAAAFAAASAAAFLRASSSARFLAFSISISIKRSIWAFNCSAERFFFLISFCIPFCFFCRFAKRVCRSFS